MQTIQQMEVQSPTGQLNPKTHLSSFQRYCSQNQRCLSQMSKLKHYFQTTITRYKKKPFQSHSQSQYKVRANRSTANKLAQSIRPKIKVKNILMCCIDPELIEVTKAKLHNNQKYQKIKTEYTVPRKNVKSYIKMKKTSEYGGHQSFNQSANLQKQHNYTTYGKDYSRYRQLTHSTELGQAIIDINKKSMKTKKNEILLDDDFATLPQGRNTIRRNKVVYSSKVNTSFNRYKYDAMMIKTSNQTSRKKEVVLTGWETHQNEDTFGVVETQPLKQARQKTVI